MFAQCELGSGKIKVILHTPPEENKTPKIELRTPKVIANGNNRGKTRIFI